MRLHVFNPDHDLALADGTPFFTPPSAARRLRQAWGYLPALWADEGDCVLVDNALQPRLSAAMEAAASGLSADSLSPESPPMDDVFLYAMHLAVRRRLSFVAPDQLRRFIGRSVAADGAGCRLTVDPWGWDAALRWRLMRCGVDDSLLPSDDALRAIRQLSHRRTAARLLPALRLPLCVGEARECFSEGEVSSLLASHGRIVVKAPWSSSGRGVRFLGPSMSNADACWLKNLLKRQGSVLVEPYYNKVIDFAMEFRADGQGRARYVGLSLFATSRAAYSGSIVASESAKLSVVGRYLPTELLHSVRSLLARHLGAMCRGVYSGPLGVDMMVVSVAGNAPSVPDAPATPSSPSYRLHPCVEVNLRRTMGHVALALPPSADDRLRVMRAMSNDDFQLKILNS